MILIKKTYTFFLGVMLATIKLLSHLNLRSAVLLAGLLVAFSPGVPSLVPAFSKSIQTFVSYAFDAPRGVSDIAVIEVPEALLIEWRKDVSDASQFAALLANILHSSKATVGVIFDLPIDGYNRAEDRLISSAASILEQQEYVQKASIAAPTTSDKILSLEQRKAFLLQLLENERVVLGYENATFVEDDPRVSFALPRKKIKWVEQLNLDFWFDCGLCPYTSENNIPIELELVQLPVIVSADPYKNYLFYENYGFAYESFLLGYLKAAYGARQSEKSGSYQNEVLDWKLGKGVVLGSDTYPASLAGRYHAIYNFSERLTPRISRISLTEALARRAFPQNILIAAENSQSVDLVAHSIFSFSQQQVAMEPWWFIIVEKAMFIFFALFLVYILSFVERKLAGLIVILMVLALLSVSIVLSVQKGLWLPFDNVIFYVTLGFLLMLIWSEKNKQWLQLANRADEASIAQAENLESNNRRDEATRILLSCSSSDKVLQKLYDFAGAYAHEENYKYAAKIYRSIYKSNKKFRDVRQKLELMKSMQAPRSNSSLDDCKTDPAFDDIGIMESKRPSDPSQLGRYQVNQEIGRGAVGRVYLGFDPVISRNVAIKTLTYDHFQKDKFDDVKARFYREAEAAGRLSHPNIVSVFDVGEEHNMAYIAMDYVEGKPLNKFVNKDSLLPVFEVYRIIADVAGAIEFAHENGIIHRDVKPGNVLYNPSPYQVKVTDFGIARLTDESRTNTGEILGSPLYMAPEQLKGKRVTRSADVFSLGVTFYQLLAGELPFSGDNLASLTYEIIHGKHKNIRTIRKDLPASAARIVNQALQKNPSDRYESAAEMLSVLKKAIRRDFAAEAKNIGWL